MRVLIDCEMVQDPGLPPLLMIHDIKPVDGDPVSKADEEAIVASFIAMLTEMVGSWDTHTRFVMTTYLERMVERLKGTS